MYVIDIDVGTMNGDSPEKKTRRSILKSGAVLASLGGAGGVASAGRATRGKGRSTPRSSSDHGSAVPPKIIIGDELKKLDWVTLIGSERDSMAKSLLRHIDNADVHSETRRRARKTLKDLWSAVQIRSEHKGPREVERDHPGMARKMAHGHGKTEHPVFARSADRTTEVYTLDSDPGRAQEIAKETEQQLRRESREVTATTADSKTAPTLAGVINSGIEAQTQDNDVGLMWMPEQGHNAISYWAGQNMNIGSDLCSILKEESKKPDRWNYDFPDMTKYAYTVGEVQEWLGGFPEKVTHAYAHAYTPGIAVPLSVGSINVPLGHADHWVGDEMQDALEHRPRSDNRYVQVGHAMHFLEDLGNPMHTGEFKTQAVHQQVHSQYEVAVADYIDLNYKPSCLPERWWKPCSPEPKDYIMDSIRGLSSFVPVEEPDLFEGNKWENHATNLAAFSSQYSTDVITATMENPVSPLQSSPWLLEDTCKVLEQATRYAMGLIGEIHPMYN